MGIKTIGKFTTDLSFTTGSPSYIDISTDEKVPFKSHTVSNSCLELEENEIKILAKGLYKIDFNATITKKCNIIAPFVMYADNNQVLGAYAAAAIHSSGDVDSISFSTVLTVGASCNKCDKATLKVLSLSDCGIIVANMIVVKVA